METWANVRLVARRVRAQALGTSGGSVDPSVVVAAALKLADLEVGHFERGPDPGELGHYDRAAGTVQVARGLPPGLEASVLAHELGHHHLHTDRRLEIGARGRGKPAPSRTGSDRYEGYSGREYKEVQADVFSAEFLCPTDVVREAMLSRGMGCGDLIRCTGLPEEMVADQVARALLLPPLRSVEDLPVPVELDADQLRAAGWTGGTLLVRGAAATGKTTALVGRIRDLLAAGTAPATILVLTSSNRAAEEMRARAAHISATAGSEAWFGTFDDLAFELVAKWHPRLGLPADFGVVDHTTGLSLLEAILGDRSRAVRFEGRPDQAAVKAFREIQRRKRLSSAPRQETGDHDRDDLHRAYDEALDGLGSLDLGGIATSAAFLLQTDTEVLASCAARFAHLLVDDLEEVDVPGLRMLDALAGAGLRTWATASGSVATYTYRGAATDGPRHLEEVLSATSITLARRHRCGSEIEALVDALSHRPPGETRREAAETGKGRLTVSRTATARDEARAIRDVAEAWRLDGVPFRDQIVVARSHLVLDTTAGNLRALGVPVLHVGDLSQRPEVRDLLALLSVDEAPERLGLFRAARAAGLDASRAEVLTLLRTARRRGWLTTTALLRAGELEGLTDRAKGEFARLGRELEGWDARTSSARSLRTWLFDRSPYLAPITALADAPENRMRLVAIHHLLRICEEHDAAGDGDFERLLGRVRRMRSLDQRTSNRQVFDHLEGVEAIRICTMHASRGLQFRGLHVPGMAEGYMPAPWRGATPPRSRWSEASRSKEEHLRLERGLLASTLSRAQHHLHLSWADRYVSRTVRPSRFLAGIPATMTASTPSGRSNRPRSGLPAGQSNPSSVPIEIPEAALITFLTCPTRYRIEVVEGLTTDAASVGGVDASPRNASKSVAQQPARPRRATAEHRGSNASELGAEVLRLPIGGGVVTIRPDRVVDDAGVIRVVRLSSSKSDDRVPTSIRDALWQQAARRRFPGRTVVVETTDFASGEPRATPDVASGAALKRCVSAVRAIRAGDFRPTRDVTRLGCASCPWYLACDEQHA